MEVAEKLAEALAAKQIAVISGMALGIDGDAHKGALAAGGCTYAVLGCGVDYCYPKEHKYLYDRIPEKGGVLSEYPVGTAPLARLFPSRNRIISGLSDCVVVVEARERSGSLITADFALEQGKDVYAVPGRLTDSLSFGCNSLIRQGAGLMLSIDDFIKEITGSSAGNSFQLDFRKNLLEKDEQLVYSLLDFVPTAVGTLLEKTSFQLLELLEILEGMENKGLIREVAPNYYAHTL
jgi:DNA processing protein